MKENTNDFPPQIQELLAAFEAAVIEDIYGEYWSARDLAKLLGYSGWQAFKGPIDKAKSSCADLGAPVEHHFKPINKMITIGKGGQRPTEDIELTRFACYLIAQNGDPAKRPEIAAAQIYFAIQTLKQEHMEKALELEAKRESDAARVEMRDGLKHHNKLLAETASSAGVKDFRVFMGVGVKALYGMSKAQVVERKGLPPNTEHLDRAGHEELAMNYFKATQAEAKIRREKIKGAKNANAAHKEMATAVRDFVKEQGGTLPEDLPPEEDVEKVRRRLEGGATKKLKAG